MSISRKSRALLPMTLCFLFLLGGVSPAAARQIAPAELAQLLATLKKSKPDTSQVELMLRLSRHYVLKPGEYKVDMDSAYQLLQQAEALSKTLSYTRGTITSWLQYSMMHREKGEKEKGISYIIKTIDLAKRSDALNLLGESYLEYSHYYSPWEEKEIDTRIEKIQQASEAFRQSGDIEKQAFTLKELSDLHTITGNYPLSIGEAKQALALYQSINYTGIQGVYDLLGVSYLYISDYTSALKYGLLAEQTANEVGDTSMQLCTILNRIGLTYYIQRDYDSAYQYHSRSFQVAEKYHSVADVYLLAGNMYNDLTRMDKFTDALHFIQQVIKKNGIPENDLEISVKVNGLLLSVYTYLGQFATAEKYYRYFSNDPKAMELARVNGSTLTFIFNYLMAVKQYAAAEELINDWDQSLNAPNAMTNFAAGRAQSHYKLDSARGNYQSAIAWLQRWNTIQDSIFDVSKIRQMETLKIEYDIKLKNQSIDLLTSKNQHQEQQIKQSQLLRNITIGGIAVLLVFLGLLYYQFRLKQKANKEIQDKNIALQHVLNEKEWLLKEIHHRVKNNLQTVVSLLESQSAYLRDDALLAIQDSQNRVYAMSLIHQKLYQAENVAAIDMSTYLPELVHYLRDSFTPGHPIQFKLNVPPLELDVSQAVPIGLIVNEAITNCIKYAFTGNNNNTISISLSQQEGNRVKLLIADNGTGLPEQFTSSSGLGLRLMRGLTEDIEGQFTIDGNNGTTITVSFDANKPLHKADEAILSTSMAEQA